MLKKQDAVDWARTCDSLSVNLRRDKCHWPPWNPLKSRLEAAHSDPPNDPVDPDEKNPSADLQAAVGREANGPREAHPSGLSSPLSARLTLVARSVLLCPAFYAQFQDNSPSFPKRLRGTDSERAASEARRKSTIAPREARTYRHGVTLPIQLVAGKAATSTIQVSASRDSERQGLRAVGGLFVFCIHAARTPGFTPA